MTRHHREDRHRNDEQLQQLQRDDRRDFDRDQRPLARSEHDAEWHERSHREMRERREDARHAFLDMQREAEALRSRERDSGYREDNTFGISNFDREQNYRGSEWVAPAGGYRPHSERSQFSGPRRGTGYGHSSGYADAERYGSSRRAINPPPLPRDFVEMFDAPRDDRDDARHAGSAYGLAHDARDFERSDRGVHDAALQRDYRGIGPKNYQRADERIREDLCDRLCDDRAVDASDIDIKVRNGIATLTGSVRERAMKHRAEDLAERIAGVIDVENQLKVKAAGRGNTRHEDAAQLEAPAASASTAKSAASRSN